MENVLEYDNKNNQMSDTEVDQLVEKLVKLGSSAMNNDPDFVPRVGVTVERQRANLRDRRIREMQTGEFGLSQDLANAVQHLQQQAD